MIDFSGWEPLPIEASGPLREAPREVAARACATLLAAREARIAALEALAARHGVALDGDLAAARLGAWLRDGAAAAGPAEIGTPRWSGLASDVALWLGERVIAAAGGALRWDFYTAHKKATGYQRAVLVGFEAARLGGGAARAGGRAGDVPPGATVDDDRYYVDVAHFVASWLELALRRRAARADFLAVIAASALADAGGGAAAAARGAS